MLGVEGEESTTLEPENPEQHRKPSTTFTASIPVELQASDKNVLSIN